mmetsp:Transcript_4814/g.7414  ORF Transcript_4814/g.7414 Transcript_4814/m.7414 type:complete len:235 (+) Transcript_4814:45-749(+)
MQFLTGQKELSSINSFAMHPVVDFLEGIASFFQCRHLIPTGLPNTIAGRSCVRLICEATCDGIFLTWILFLLRNDLLLTVKVWSNNSKFVGSTKYESKVNCHLQSYMPLAISTGRPQKGPHSKSNNSSNFTRMCQHQGLILLLQRARFQGLVVPQSSQLGRSIRPLRSIQRFRLPPRCHQPLQLLRRFLLRQFPRLLELHLLQSLHLVVQYRLRRLVHQSHQLVHQCRILHSIQ